MGDQIQGEYRETMNALAGGVDEIFNGRALPGLPRAKKVAFVLLTAEFGKYEGGRVNYISNADRADMVAMLTELLARFQGRHQEGGRA